MDWMPNRAAAEGNIDAAWFLSGTCILTDRGEMPVETLRVGTNVFTRSGSLRPIRRIGTGNFSGGALDRAGAPVRICHGALGADTPYRDLFVAPDHAVEINGHLVAAGLLVNDVTITQDPAPTGIECFHLELDAQDCVLADWAWAETHRGASIAIALPRIADQADPRLPALRAGVTPSMSHDGLIADANVHLVVNGLVVRPMEADGPGWRFPLRAGIRSVRLRSRASRPSVVDGAQDHRRLGLCVTGLAIRFAGTQAAVALNHPTLDDGFHAVEKDGRWMWRWTDGDAILPVPLLGDGRMPVTLVVTGYALPLYASGGAMEAVRRWYVGRGRLVA